MRLFTILLLLLPASLHAQAPDEQPQSRAFLSGQYNDEGAGSNLNVNYHQPLGNRGWRLYAGLRFHLNRTNYTTGPLYTNQLYTKGIGEHLGLKAGIEKGYAVFPKAFHSELYGFFDIQYAHGALRSEDPFTNEAITRGPATYIQNYFGLGLRSALSEQLGLRAFAGVGADFIHDRNSFGGGLGIRGLTYNFARILGFGVEYHLH